MSSRSSLACGRFPRAEHANCSEADSAKVISEIYTVERLLSLAGQLTLKLWKGLTKHNTMHITKWLYVNPIHYRNIQVH